MNRILLYNEDNLQAMRLMSDKQFDLAIVDPPYGIKQDSHRVASRSKLAKTTDFGDFDWDKEPAPQEWFDQLFRVSKNQIVWGANHFISRMPFNSSCWIVWDKDNGDSNYADCELAWCSFDTAVRIFKFRWNGMLQGNMKQKEERIHPTQKPVELYRWLLQKYAQPGWLILDTHLGSGSIALACHDLGYNLTAYEIQERFYSASIARFNNYIKQGTTKNWLEL